MTSYVVGAPSSVQPWAPNSPQQDYWNQRFRQNVDYVQQCRDPQVMKSLNAPIQASYYPTMASEMGLHGLDQPFYTRPNYYYRNPIGNWGSIGGDLFYKPYFWEARGSCLLDSGLCFNNTTSGACYGAFYQGRTCPNTSTAAQPRVDYAPWQQPTWDELMRNFRYDRPGFNI